MNLGAVMPPEDNTPPNWVERETEDFKIIPWPSKSITGIIYHIKDDKRQGRLYCDCAASKFGKKCTHIRDYLKMVTRRDYVPLNGVKQTSIDAYGAMKPRLGEQHLVVQGTLEENGPMCNRQIADRTSMSIASVTARVYELRKANQIEFSHKAKDPMTGMTVMFWKAVE